MPWTAAAKHATASAPSMLTLPPMFLKHAREFHVEARAQLSSCFPFSSSRKISRKTPALNNCWIYTYYYISTHVINVLPILVPCNSCEFVSPYIPIINIKGLRYGDHLDGTNHLKSVFVPL